MFVHFSGYTSTFKNKDGYFPWLLSTEVFFYFEFFENYWTEVTLEDYVDIDYIFSSCEYIFAKEKYSNDIQYLNKELLTFVRWNSYTFYCNYKKYIYYSYSMIMEIY